MAATLYLEKRHLGKKIRTLFDQAPTDRLRDCMTAVLRA